MLGEAVNVRHVRERGVARKVAVLRGRVVERQRRKRVDGHQDVADVGVDGVVGEALAQRRGQDVHRELGEVRQVVARATRA